jgi:hypothetical protein
MCVFHLVSSGAEFALGLSIFGIGPVRPKKVSPRLISDESQKDGKGHLFVRSL